MYSGQSDIDAVVKAIYYNKSFATTTEQIPEGTPFGIILDRTSFYAESGGQEYDTGNLIIDGSVDFAVTNVQVFNGYVLHIGYLKYGALKVGETVISHYDEVRRTSYRPSCSVLNTNSSAVGRYATITLLLTSSITHCGKH